MKKIAALGFSLLVVAGCEAGAGSSWGNNLYRTRNHQLVVPSAEPGGPFEVVAVGGTGGSGFYCAAADYAHSILNYPGTAKLVVTRPVGPSVANPGGRSVFFQATESEDVPYHTGILMSVSKEGDSASVGLSRTACGSYLGVNFWSY